MELQYIFLIFLRVSGIFVLSPIFGRRNVPNILKAGLCLCISYIIAGAYPAVTTEAASAPSLPEYVVMCIKELIIGLAMGYMVILFFNAANTAGQIIDIQIGFGLAQIYDPDSYQSVPVVSSFMNIGLLLYFFTLNGHHMLIKILYLTFDKIPPGSLAIKPAAVAVIAGAFALAFVMAVSIALPVIAAELLVEAAFGVIVRAVPQMNVFIAGIPVKIIVGLIVLTLMTAAYSNYANAVFDGMYTQIDKLLGKMVV